MQIHLRDGKTIWKQEWHEIGGKRKFYRSKAEYRYALYLEYLKSQGQIKEWEHEPETFWFKKIKRGTNNYKPDFRITLLNDNLEYHEVKGFMDAKSRTKIKRMSIYHPNIKLRVIQSDWFRRNNKMLKSLIKEY
jgi:hypothetical protein